MNANDVVRTLSRKHKRLPAAALEAAVSMRAEVAPLMLEKLQSLIAAMNATLEAPTEREHLAQLKRAVTAPSPVFYGFFLAAEWKQTEAFQPFTELLGWPHAMMPNLLSEAVASEDVGSRVLAEFYNGDLASLLKLLTDRDGVDSVQFLQWRTLIRLGVKDQIHRETLQRLLARAFDELEPEADRLVWSGWESVIIYFGLTDLVPLVERAHEGERMFERTIDDFHREWAYARANPDCPFKGDPIVVYRGLMAEVAEAIESR